MLDMNSCKINFCHFFSGSTEKQKILTKDANKLVKRVIDCLVKVQHALADRSIDVKTLTSLNQFEDTFMHLCLALPETQSKSGEHQKSHFVKMNLKQRMEEYRVFEKMRKHLQHFIDICRSMKDVGKSK